MHPIPSRVRDARPCIGPAFVLLALCFAFAPSSARAAAWQQSEFVIGTWIDPNVVPGDREYSAREIARARAAYVNLLTGTHSRAGGATLPIDTTRLELLDDGGLPTAITHPIWYGMGGQDPATFATTPPTAPADFLAKTRAPALSAAADRGLAGFCLWDEVPDGALQAKVSAHVKSWTAAVHDADSLSRPGLPPRFAWVNFFHLCRPDTCYRAYLDAYMADPDPRKRPDVASVGLWPFTGPTENPGRAPWYAWMEVMRQAVAPRPFWVISMLSEAQADPGFSRPDANQIRAMAFGAAAAGAKGVLWYGYGNRHTDDGETCFGALCPEAAVQDGSLPTDKYELIAPVNHYLHTIVGPVVMNTTFGGLFHSSTETGYGDPRASVRLFGDPACPVVSLASAGTDTNFAAGVFRTTDGSGDVYLLVINKLLTPVANTLVLRTPAHVAAAPRAAGYVGGDDYSPLSDAAQSTIPVSLAGGEGRMYRLSTTPREGLVLDSPRGGETWRPGETRTVRWHGTNAPVTVILLADVDANPGELRGPAIVTHANRVGGADTLTMPAVRSRHVRVVLQWIDAAGAAHRVTHNDPLQTAPEAGGALQAWSLGGTNGSLVADLTLDAAGVPHVVRRDSLGQLVHHTFTGTGWRSERIPEVVEAGVPAGTYVNTYGEPSIEVGRDGVVHIVAKALFYGLRFEYTSLAPGQWLDRMFAAVDPYVRDADAVLAADTMYLACSAGLVGGGRATLLARDAAPGHLLADWTEPAPAPPAAPWPRDVAVASDAQGRPCIASVSGAGGDSAQVLHVRQRGAAGWSDATLTGNFSVLDLAIDGAGRPAIVYAGVPGPTGNTLVFRTWNGTAWSAAEPVEPVRGMIRGASLAWVAGVPAVAYVDGGLAKFAARAGGTWRVLAMEPAVEAAAPIRLAFGPDGTRWVLYHDRTSRQARIVRTGPGALDVAPEPAPRVAAFARFAGANPIRAGEPLRFVAHSPEPRRLEVALYDVAGRRLESHDFGVVGDAERTLAWRPAERRPGVCFLRWSFEGGAAGSARVVVLR